MFRENQLKGTMAAVCFRMMPKTLDIFYFYVMMLEWQCYLHFEMKLRREKNPEDYRFIGRY